MNSQPGYVQALAALQFFCLSSDLQIAAAHEQASNQPVFFPGNRIASFLFGVACVFKSYQGYLFDRIQFGHESESVLADFVHRLNVAMNEADAAEWSEDAIAGQGTWERLRRDANRALDELGEPSVANAPRFDIGTLINPDDFRTATVTDTSNSSESGLAK